MTPVEERIDHEEARVTAEVWAPTCALEHPSPTQFLATAYLDLLAERDGLLQQLNTASDVEALQRDEIEHLRATKEPPCQ